MSPAARGAGAVDAKPRAGRVLVLTSEFPPGPGGIGTHAHQLTLGLQRRGWEALVLASQDYAGTADVEAFNATQPFRVIRFRRIPGSPFEAAYREIVLARALRSFAPDVLIASGSRPVMLAAARLAGRKIPLVAMGHGTEFGARGGWQAAAIRSAFGRAAAIVCVSEFTRSQMHAAGIRAPEERVIPNGADPERFRRLPEADAPAIRMDLGLPPDVALVVTVGNVTARKGQDIVVRALARIREPLHYAIVGMPTRGVEIARLAEELGVADRVHLLGRLDPTRLVRLLNAADIFAMTSRHTADGDFEGYGIAVVEAALCGLPAVVAAGSGLSEAVADGETGFCVASEDPAATAAGIRRLLEDRALRARMGEQAQRRAEREQTWECRLGDYDALLRELIRR